MEGNELKIAPVPPTLQPFPSLWIRTPPIIFIIVQHALLYDFIFTLSRDGMSL